MLNINGVNSNLNVSSTSGISALQKTEFAKEESKVSSFEDELLKAQSDEELKEACDQFEQYFINMMFKQMQKTVHKDNSPNAIFKESHAESVMKDFLHQEYAKEMTNAGGIGLSNMLYEQMKVQNDARLETEKLLNEEKQKIEE